MIGARPSPPSVQPSAASLQRGLDRAPISVGIPEAKVQANRAPVEVEHRAGLDAVLEVGSARLTYESAEPRARVDGRTVKPGGAR